MKAAASLVLVALMTQEPVCRHESRGASKPLDLEAVARAHDHAARTFTFLVDGIAPASMEGFDSGLPRCRARALRRVRVDQLPEGMKALHFAPAGTPAPEGALSVATSARSMTEALTPAGAELAARFGVRCAPTLVRPVSREEVELVEGE